MKEQKRLKAEYHGYNDCHLADMMSEEHDLQPRGRR